MIFFIFGFLAMPYALLYPVLCQGKEDTKKESANINQTQDKGTSRIDVSKYPPQMRGYYKLFAKRCSKCHSLARPINSDYCLPDEWRQYIRKMLRKPGSGVYLPDGKKIYDFLVYDSGIRKKECIEKKTMKIEK